MVLCILLLRLLYLVPEASSQCADISEKYISGLNTNVEEALKFLADNNKLSLEINNRAELVRWAYQSNLTEENKNKMLEMDQRVGKFNKESWKTATSFAWKNFKSSNKTAYRWFKNLAVLGTAALPDEKFKEFNTLTADMQDTYAKAKVCRFNSKDEPCDLSIEPELTEIMAKSRDYDQLKHVWSQWRDVTGKQMKTDYLKYINLSNEAACRNGFSDAGALWREAYESDNFEEEIENLWVTLRPLYHQLHAYVRRKLILQYPNNGIRPDGPIPAHLLGNMWSQTWGNIFDIVKPYPNKKFTDVTETLKSKKISRMDMFKISEEFFTSLDLIKMTPEFWNRSIIEKPTDRDMVCHASAWDFLDGKDFRIKMCTEINMEDFITVHHEMGHNEYDLQYSHHPMVFRSGANPGFHEAVGDTISLSVQTPQHLKKIGLLESSSEDPEATINSLMNTALNKIAFLPFGYLIDAWRWKVFDGTIKEEDLNSKWWTYRLHYQGLCPPVERTNDDLDAAAKYHVIADVPYIRYFVSYVIQFQFHKALCDAAGHTGPLHECDIYRNKEAGRLLRNTLSLGSSVHWRKAMEVITNGKTDQMDARPMMEYFKPLSDWLKKQNQNEYIGWKSENPMMCS